MARKEIELAMDALMKAFEENAGMDLPQAIEALKEDGFLEDAIRAAFWFLVSEGRLVLNEDFEAVVAA